MSKRVPFPAKVRERAVRMVLEVTPKHDSLWAAIHSILNECDRLLRRTYPVRFPNDPIVRVTQY